MNKAALSARILDITEDLFFEGNVMEVSLERIAKKAGVEISDVTAIYPSLEDVTKALSERNIALLHEKGMLLAKQKGIEPLRQLLSNDIRFFYRIEIDRVRLNEQTLIGHVAALKNFDDYFATKMPEVYTEFFRNNKDLLPSKDIDIVYYAHFISHSLKFFNFKTLVNYEPTCEGRKAATEQIIGSLFSQDELTLDTF